MQANVPAANLTSTLGGLPTGQVMVRSRESSRPIDDPVDPATVRLTRGVAAGDESAFRELFDCYRDRLFRFLLVLTRGDELAANELVQSVMLTAASKLRPLRTEAHLWNWLAQVARQQHGKKFRQSRREARLFSFGAVPDVAATPTPEDQLARALDAALAELDEESRSLVELFYFERWSHQALAERHGTTAKAIAGRLDRLRDKLRQGIVQTLKHET